MEISNQIQVEQQVRQLNDEWVKALVRGDGETLNRIMADDFIFTYPLEGDDKEDFIGERPGYIMGARFPANIN